jgi:hypothetical protein
MIVSFRTRLVSAGLLACACGALHASGQTYSIDAHVVAAGSSMRSGSTCFRMRATISEPVGGYSSSANYSLAAGFRAANPGAGDDIHFSGFENCP